MTVSTTTNKIKYTLDGVTDEFAFSFPVVDSSDLYCYLVDSDGIQTSYTDFTVVLDDDAGGTVTTGSVLPADDGSLLIIRDTALDQELDLIEGGKFPAESIEAAFDKQVMMIQDQQEELDRSLKSPSGSSNPLELDTTNITSGKLLKVLSEKVTSSDFSDSDIQNIVDTLEAFQGDAPYTYIGQYVNEGQEQITGLSLYPDNSTENAVNGDAIAIGHNAVRYDDSIYRIWNDTTFAALAHTVTSITPTTYSNGETYLTVVTDQGTYTFLSLNLYLARHGGNGYNVMSVVAADPYGWGCTYDNTTDDSTAIQACIDYLESFDGTSDCVLSGQYLKIDSGLTIDTYYCSLIGNTLIDASAITADIALTVNCSVGSEPANSYSRKGESEKIRFKGPGRTSTGSVGILFNSAVSGSNANMRIDNVSVYDFEVGHKHLNRAYNSVIEKSEILQCAKAIQMPTGAGDYGEKIVYTGCVIYNNDLFIDCNNGSGWFVFTDCSIDYNTLNGTITAGSVYLNNCHVESSSYASVPFTVGSGNGAALVMNGGHLLCAETNSVSMFNVTTSENEGGGVFLNNVYMNNLGSSVDYLATGTGRITVNNPISYDTQNNPKFISAQNNNLLDGGFEGTNILDAYISDDTQTITDELTGTNIQLTLSTDYANSGSQSMQVTKPFGAGSACEFTISVPLLNRQSLATKRLYYRKPGSSTGTVYAITGYARVERDSNGVRTSVKETTVGSETITFTSADTGWLSASSGEPKVYAPAWATHAFIKFNLNTWAATGESLYIDDAEIQEW